MFLFGGMFKHHQERNDGNQQSTFCLEIFKGDIFRTSGVTGIMTMLSTSFVEVKDQLSCTFEIMRFLSILIGESPGVLEFEEQNHVYAGNRNSHATDRESVSENDLEIGG